MDITFRKHEGVKKKAQVVVDSDGFVLVNL